MNYVLMADIINSSGFSNLSKLAKTFAELVEKCNIVNQEELISPLTITLGDEFQGIVRRECSIFKIITWLEENKWKADEEISLRYSVELGEIETEINTKIAHGMMGPALTEARESLILLKDEEDLLSIGGDIKDKELKQIQFNLYLSHVRKWHWRDNVLISNLLELKDYKLVAEKTNKNRSLVWKRNKTLGMDNYFKLKRSLEILLCR
ncbi:SatD family protein [Cyclobacterium roseum]|uniref:SatD family protein n=1 Tax=Cyclobacterium roseum TaxID=2666137 RepID=UPI001390CD5F|nr:SatD family protein [Cyclobacterium roseum]